MLSYITCVDGDTNGGKLQDADPSRRQHSGAYTLTNPRNQTPEIAQLLSRREVFETLEAAEELRYKLAIVSARPGELAVLTSVLPCKLPPPAVLAVTS